MNPTLPPKKSSGSARKTATALTRTQNILNASEIVLEDGTKIPIKLPQGMSPVQAQALLTYLKCNPEAAKTAAAQAQQILKNPSLASAFKNMHALKTPENADKYSFLKEDPDLAPVWEDIQANGPSALEKYWEDEVLMAKISSKMRAMQLKDQPQKALNTLAAPVIENIFDAAKHGVVDAARSLIEGGADVNAKNEKFVTALGIAVGFNRKEVTELLIDRGADVMQLDGKGNTVLHYAAGYGRKEIAALLIGAGAKVHALNHLKQSPLDVAKLNKEKAMVEFLESYHGKEDATMLVQ
ncbi:hypothetical protein CEUSTIGMA_g10613.t1 [Chlamydomonas eustigma]|uniref:Uncharacterized protein n=1 Tax=Chlamydomonas eustigma TaxID=1157962 RepID=A0A250XJD7_9CHLO|nr:hypothetical protein CEUSTIGMA_g10613.t1 [Chlamydomonas eustigma]|eukprot:GAX83187.1 hypothetical protein CEUSTIGMA_g10613.t1 [Chlamydomonas eustigma]